MENSAPLKRAQSDSTLSHATCNALGTTELLDYIFDFLPGRDLIRARPVCKLFDDTITSEKASNYHKLKTFLHPSSSPPTDHTAWKHMPQCVETWQPYIGTREEAKNDFRARPILAVNPAFAKFEMPPKTNSSTYGFQDAIVPFDAGAFTAAIKSGSCWENTVLTQPGCKTVSLSFPDIASSYSERFKAKYPGRHVDFVAILDRYRIVPVYATGPGGFVTLGDVKRAIVRTVSLLDGDWLKMDNVKMIIDGCVTELSNCVRHARARECGEVVDRVFNPWRAVT